MSVYIYNLFCLLQLEEYYYYQTGSSWSARVGLMDSAGNPTNFNAPLTLIYKHSGTTSNSGSSYDGAAMLLTYDGPSQLTGIPQLCLDPATYLPGDCISEATDSTTNLNDITISPTTALTDLLGNKYYALPRVGYEYFPKTVDSACSSLTLGDLPSVATNSDVYTDPSNKGQGIPTDAELKAGYLKEGKPVVIKGVTLWEAK